jgi:hypothetical protein
MTSMDTTQRNTGDQVRSNRGSYRQDVIGAPARRLNVPSIPASDFVPGERRDHSRDDGTTSWKPTKRSGSSPPQHSGWIVAWTPVIATRIVGIERCHHVRPRSLRRV